MFGTYRAQALPTRCRSQGWSCGPCLCSGVCPLWAWLPVVLPGIRPRPRRCLWHRPQRWLQPRPQRWLRPRSQRWLQPDLRGGLGFGLWGGPFGYHLRDLFGGVGFSQPFTPADTVRGRLFGFGFLDALWVVDRVLLGRAGGWLVPRALDARGVCARARFVPRSLFGWGTAESRPPLWRPREKWHHTRSCGQSDATA
jgi:hypothetical protein